MLLSPAEANRIGMSTFVRADWSWMASLRFLAVRVGDLVVVEGPLGADNDWWVGQVIHAEGGARCQANSLFQIACIDSGCIRTVNADAVLDILQAGPREPSGALQTPHNHAHQQQGSGQGHQQGDRHGGVQQQRRF